MIRTALVGASILTPDGWRDDCALIIAGARIEDVVPVAGLGGGIARAALDGGFLIPGFIDTQVNGGGGALLNDSPTAATIAVIARAHRRFGTTGLLPTLISDDLDVVAAAIAAVDEAIAAGVPGVLGIHVEGPFLNAAKRGIHDDAKFRRIDGVALALLSSLRHGKTLVTLAPELAADGMIAALVASGVIVAAGHSLATYDEMQRALSEGLTGVTHLFNAMSQLESRAPGLVGAALDSAQCVCGIIADGHHVHPAALRIAYAARGGDGLMLVTDAMPIVGGPIVGGPSVGALGGSGESTFTIGGRVITVKDGVCRAPDGTLAGSALDMAAALRNAMAMIRIDLRAASAMASGVPAQFLGLAHERGALAAGLQADVVHLNASHQVTATWIAGHREIAR